MNPNDLDESLTAIPLPKIEARVRKLQEEMQKLQLKLQTWSTILSYRQQMEQILAQQRANAGADTDTDTGNGATPPTLREGIRTILLEARKPLTAQQIRVDLERRGWLPEGAYGNSRAYGMLSGMYKKGELLRPEQGKYELPGVAAPPSQ